MHSLREGTCLERAGGILELSSVNKPILPPGLHCTTSTRHNYGPTISQRRRRKRVIRAMDSFYQEFATDVMTGLLPVFVYLKLRYQLRQLWFTWDMVIAP